MNIRIGLWLVCWLACWPGSPAWAQSPVAGIYTCVDAQGRKLTADRPIPECMDREQKVLNPSGTLKQKIVPPLSAAERAQLEAKEKAQAEERKRAEDVRRQDHALFLHYPNKAAHDKERAVALEQIADGSRAAVIRLKELAVQRKKLDDEMEFYKKDPAKAPQYLRRQLDENKQNVSAQERILGEQADETRRLHARFDEELQRLRQLWPSGAK
jgi:hypothetical protein